MPRLINLSTFRSESEKAAPQEKNPNEALSTNSGGNEIILQRNLEMLQKLHKDKVNYSIEETAKKLNVSYEFTREAIKKGKINSKLFGDRPMVNVHELARILTEGIDG